MKLRIPNVHIIDPKSMFHDQTMDILVEDGVITAIAEDLSGSADETWDVADGRCISPGWVDIRSYCGAPGHEERETYRSLAKAACRGGFTQVALMPNTSPTRDSRPHIEALESVEVDAPVVFLGIGAVTRGCQGEKLSEIMDMQQAGAVSFSDGGKGMNNPHLLQLALEYSDDLDVTIQSHALDMEMCPTGSAHEGEAAVQSGLSPIPSIAETLRIQRDLSIHAYAGGRLHIAGVSTAEGVEMIRQAKAQGQKVTADVPVANLVGVDQDITSFDTAYKVLPPLRSAADQEALWQGLLDGTLDMVAMNHQPMDVEHSDCEWGLAKFGAATIDHAFGWYHEQNNSSEALSRWIEAVCHAPRKLYNIGDCSIAVGSPADLTVFALDGTNNQWETLGVNRPSWAQNGRAIATMLGNKRSA